MFGRICILFVGAVFALSQSSCRSTKAKTAEAAVRSGEDIRKPGVIPQVVETGTVTRGTYDDINDLARFLAGMPGGRSSDLLALRETAFWQTHQDRMNGLWSSFASNHLSKIRGWRGQISDISSPSVLFYPFSGPDFVYADALFPGARDYVLCGLEPVNRIPNPAALSAAENATSLGSLYGSLTTVLHYSFFITKDMRTEFASGQFRGVLPRLYVFLARTGHDIESVQPISLNNTPVAWSSTVPGVHITARSGFGGRKNIFYFTANLANGGSGSRVMSFANSRGTPVTFIKSASYLLHDGGFSNIRQFILNNSRAVLQDPSGVPHRFYAKGGWDITYYGNYVRTLDMFRSNYQADLAAAYKNPANQIKALPFGIGYVFSPGETSLIVARKGRPLND